MRGNGTTTATSSAAPERAALPPIILGVETSCDDTGVAVVRADGQVLSERLVGQAALHAPYGGVVPTVAAEAHRTAIAGAIAGVLGDAKIGPGDLSAVAVTVGPGLSLCLKEGVRAAQALANAHDLPLVPVHHMEAHALVARLPARGLPDAASIGGVERGGALAPRPGEALEAPPPSFPFLALLASGGHTLFVMVRSVGSYVQLGTTLDDAAGEAFDKVARQLGLGGEGAAVERAARTGDPAVFPLPTPMSRVATCDLSFAGLKTAVREAARKGGLATTPGEERPGAAGEGATDPGPEPGRRRPPTPADLAASFQQAAADHLAQRTRRAVQWCRDDGVEISALVLAGGVARNAAVRRAVAAEASRAGLRFVSPPASLCSDNGVMVAWAAFEALAAGVTGGGEGGRAAVAVAAAAAAAPAASGVPAEAGVPLSVPAASAPTSVADLLADPETFRSVAPPPPLPPPALDHDIEVRPRWPLTGDVDPRSRVSRRSAKKARIFESLTAMMRQGSS